MATKTTYSRARTVHKGTFTKRPRQFKLPKAVTGKRPRILGMPGPSAMRGVRMPKGGTMVPGRRY